MWPALWPQNQAFRLRQREIATSAGPQWRIRGSPKAAAGCSGSGEPQTRPEGAGGLARQAAAGLLAASLLLTSPPAFADLNKFEANTRGEFGIGSAAQYGSADLRKTVHANENFRRANFTSADMREADFSGSNFVGGYLEKAVAFKTNFEGADFSDALMDRMVLNEANLKDAVLVRVVLTRSDLADAKIEGADFSDAVLDLPMKQALCKYASGVNPSTGMDTRKSLGCGNKRKPAYGTPSAPELSAPAQKFLTRDGFCDDSTGKCKGGAVFMAANAAAFRAARASVPPEVYRLLDGLGREEKWWEVTDLLKLVLSHNDISTISDELGDLLSLVHLDVRHNRLEALPECLGRLQQLKYLLVSNNQLKALPASLAEATALVRLDAGSNGLSSLPSNLGALTQLVELKVPCNRLVHLPEGIKQLRSLTSLDIEDNRLTSIADGIFNNLSMLQTLNAAKNELASIPNEFANMSKLVHLNLRDNSKRDQGGATFPWEVYIIGNAIFGFTELSNCICQLHLVTLDVSDNDLSMLPPELGKMETLTHLVTHGNRLRSIRSNLLDGPISALLKHLRDRLPANEEAGANASSGNIFGADLQHQITVAAREAACSKVLVLSDKQLLDIPGAAWEISDLASLDLSRNCIISLASRLAMFQSLEKLDVSRNKIRAWPGAVLSCLSSLRTLSVSWNPIQELPQDAMASIPRIQTLDISGIAATVPSNFTFTNVHNLRNIKLDDFAEAQFVQQQSINSAELPWPLVAFDPAVGWEPPAELLKETGTAKRADNRGVDDDEEEEDAAGPSNKGRRDKEGYRMGLAQPSGLQDKGVLGGLEAGLGGGLIGKLPKDAWTSP
eukprot:SM000044S16042  [mRNA]  locus=s44:630619:639263:- [translate_table: standard]